MNSNDAKTLFKLIQVFPQANIISNDTLRLADFILCQWNFNKEDRKNIFKLIENRAWINCSYSPVTQIAGISYWYFKKYPKKKRSLQTICDSCFVSQNSVHLYSNHYCTKKWTLELILLYRIIEVLYYTKEGVSGVYSILYLGFYFQLEKLLWKPPRQF